MTPSASNPANEVVAVLDLVMEGVSPPSGQFVRVGRVESDLYGPVHDGNFTGRPVTP